MAKENQRFQKRNKVNDKRYCGRCRFCTLYHLGNIITTAGSLHNHGVTEIQSAEQAAKSLEPLVKSFPNSGEMSKLIFAIGIVGIGLLSIPVLAWSTAYALSDAFKWKEGLSKKIWSSKGILFSYHN